MVRVHRVHYLLLLSVAVSLGGLPASAQVLVGRTQAPPDISGEWVLEVSEDQGQLGGLQPAPDDYMGVPFNDAGRMRSDTTAESL